MHYILNISSKNLYFYGDEGGNYGCECGHEGGYEH